MKVYEAFKILENLVTNEKGDFDIMIKITENDSRDLIKEVTKIQEYSNNNHTIGFIEFKTYNDLGWYKK